jgi:hypothetical protein
MNYLDDGSKVAAQARPGDIWINRSAAATVTGLAGVAGALSYSHMRQLAQDQGQVGWHAHAFPLSVDGIEIVASLVLLADRRAGRRSGWLPWAALAVGTAGSLAANIATAHPDPVSRVIAGWPALALLLAVKLLSVLLERRNASASADHPVQASNPVIAAHRTAVQNADQFAVDACPARIRSNRTESQDQPPPSSPVAADLAPDSDTTLLLSAARAARDALHQDGQTLTRDTLAARLRQHGQPIRNASVTPLLQVLRNEATGSPAMSSNRAI